MEIGVRQRLQEDLLDDRKDRRIGADAKRHREQRGGGEARSFAEHAQREQDILPDHQLSPRWNIKGLPRGACQRAALPDQGQDADGEPQIDAQP
jgi:hypothetical protein